MEAVKDRRMVDGTTCPITHRLSTIQDAPRPHPRRRRWGLVVLGPVGSVRPGEAVQQSARVDVRPLVDDGDEGDLEDGVGEIGVRGEAGDSVGQLGQLGLEGFVCLGTVDQPPQRDVDPARHFLPLEVPDVARGLGYEGVNQLERFVGIEVGHEESQCRTQVPVGDLLAIFDVAEREG